jgi:hypothetical protein
MRTVRLELLISGSYRVKYHKMTRYYNDDTLPDGIKHPLGMLMFGARDRSIGQVVQHPFIPFDADRAFLLRVDDDTARTMFGDKIDDTRSQG